LFRVDFNRDVAAPEVVERLVPDDGRHPGHRCGEMALIVGGVVPDGDEALLQYFFGELALMQYTQREAKQFR
jgi:hypothetical protein